MPGLRSILSGGKRFFSFEWVHLDPPNWEDERSPATMGKQGALDKPDFDYTNLGLLFPQNDATEKLYIMNQLPHAAKTGTVVYYPHVHFIQTSAALPVFKLQYRFYNNGATVPSFTEISTATGGGIIFPYSSGSILQVLPFPSVEVADVEPSTWYDMIFFREDNAVTGDVLVKSFDFHIAVDTPGGSRQEFSK